jgi:hypothetical protein
VNHKLYISEKTRGRFKDLVRGLANHLGVAARFNDVLVVETDDPRLADMTRTLAQANGELLDLVDPAALLQPSGLKTREEIEQEERDFWEKHNLIEKGEGRLMVISNEDHAELHSPKPVMEMVAEVAEPPAKKARKPRTYKPRQCEVCGQMYTPTGPRAKHKDCPGKVNGAEPQPAEEPIGTVTTWDHHALIGLPPAFIAELHGTSKAAGIDEPLMCLTAGGGHHALLSADAFLTYYYGTHQASGVTDPIYTLTGTDHAALVGSLENLTVEDLTFRMLKPHEIGKAMAFPGEYVVLGNNHEKVKQYGNAVTPPVMEMILKRCVETLA